MTSRLVDPSNHHQGRLHTIFTVVLNWRWRLVFKTLHAQCTPDSQRIYVNQLPWRGALPTSPLRSGWLLLRWRSLAFWVLIPVMGMSAAPAETLPEWLAASFQ
ncbi:hypothetical protein O9993_11715 [Vibrio lentus]|nr:hypothetical protein [Vibrio lentus]